MFGALPRLPCSAVTASVLLQINPNLLKKKSKNSVRLVVEFGSFDEAEKIIMVSFRSGYIFIQTDKPVYNPGDTGQNSHCMTKH
ncbi:Complement C3 [Anabarilius grahami]|uniref:Complement C3 n=1 Tax=Anabarilius grahami TaxID=495550 RepID=A0A3N0XHW4_ANAGA|nr:Complement C3 [Anabarilius grahami]